MSDETVALPTLAEVFRRRSLALMRVSLLYQIALSVVITPLLSISKSLATSATGAPALINSAIVGLAKSPASLAWLALGALIAVSASMVQSAACAGVILSGTERTVIAVEDAARRITGLLRIAGAVLWRTGVLTAPIVIIAGVAYVVRFGFADVVGAYARGTGALTAIGVGAGAAVGILWLYLFLRWVWAIPLLVTEGLRGGAALRRSWELTRGVWWKVGLQLAAVQLFVVAVCVTAITLVNVGVVNAGTRGVDLSLGLLIGLSVLFTLGSGVLLNLSYQTLLLTRFLDATRSALPERVGLPSTRLSWLLLTATLLIALVTGALGAAVAWVLLSDPVNITKVELIAHRAGEHYAPENTIAAVEQARIDRAPRLEFDVQRTADDKLVVIHDADTLRVSGKDVSIANSTLAKIKTVDIGSYFDPRFADQRVPTLEEFLDAAGDTPLALEIKTHKNDELTTRQVVELLQKRGAIDRTVLISLDPKLTELAHSLDPALKTGDLISLSTGVPTSLPADIIAPSEGLATAQFVLGAHLAGKKVWVWTIDDEDLVKAAALRGVDGIITSDIPRARAALDSLRNVGAADIARRRLTDLIMQ